MSDSVSYWQRGAITGFLIVTAIVGLQFLVLMGNEARLESKGLPHLCTGGALCSFVDAAGGYGKAFLPLVVLLGIIAGIVGAVIGILLDKIRLKYD